MRILVEIDHLKGIDLKSFFRDVVGVEEIEAQLDRLNRNIGARMTALDAAIADVATQVAAFKTEAASDAALINGIPGLIQKGIDDALAKGATADELATLAGLKTEIGNNVGILAAARIANTPAATLADPPASNSGAAPPTS